MEKWGTIWEQGSEIKENALITFKEQRKKHGGNAIGIGL